MSYFAVFFLASVQMRFVSKRTRTYSMEVQVIWLIVFNLRLMVFEKHMRNLYHDPLLRTTWKR